MKLKIQCQYLSVSVFLFWKTGLRCMRAAYRSTCSWEFKGSYINLSRLRVWQPQSWCDLSTHTHRIACKRIGSWADLPWISKDLKRSHTRAEIKECLYMTNGNTFQKKSQDRPKKSPGLIKPLTLILKKNQKDSGLILLLNLISAFMDQSIPAAPSPPPNPQAYCGVFARLVSPGGGAH